MTKFAIIIQLIITINNNTIILRKYLIRRNMNTMKRNSKFKLYIEKYLEREKYFIKESSYAIYNSYVYSKIIPRLGHVKLEELNIDIIQEFCNNLLINGNSRTGSGLSYRTTKDIMIFLVGSIDYLFKQNIIKSFDLTYKIQKNIKPKSLKTFTDYEVIMIRDYLKNSKDPRDLGILIAMYSGLRIGEICALKWNDIDLMKSTISVNKTLQRIFIKTPTSTTSTLKESSPKSSKSNRVLPINSELRLHLINNINNNGYILSHNDIPVEPRSLRYHFSAILKKLNVPNRPFHSLRHTFATRLIKNTNDFKTVSELLGHSSISITLDIYTHTSEETKVQCINKF